MFQNNKVADPDVSGWDTSNATTFWNCLKTHQMPTLTLAADLSDVANIDEIFLDSGIDTENYSKFLVTAGGRLDDVAPCSRTINLSINDVGDGGLQFYGEAAASAKNLVDIGWSFNDGGGYALIENLLSWDDAKSNCENDDGYLATVDSSNVRDILTGICFPDSWDGGSADDCWLGLKNTAGSGVAGNWAEGIAYTSIDFNLDNIDHFGNDRCLNLEAHYADGTLEGATCSNTRRSICEYPPD